jgi:hypothetical protein
VIGVLEALLDAADDADATTCARFFQGVYVCWRPKPPLY